MGMAGGSRKERAMEWKLAGTVTLLQVFDMPRSLHFYRDLLGFAIIQQSQPVDRCGWAWLRRDDSEIMLNTAYEDEFRPLEPDPGRIRAHQDTILYFACPDVDAAWADLRSMGIAAAEPANAPYGMRQLYFEDPDGFGICFQWKSG
jgi:catechol 2,3-dioxygenase-like lactoylglutathione lyase family enzyme